MAGLEIFDGTNWIVIGGNSGGGINLVGDITGSGLTNGITLTNFNITKNFDVVNHKIINLSPPTLFNDAATKGYVDNKTWTASQITDFDTQVRLSRLDQMALPTISLNANSQKIINLAAPVLSTDAVNKNYADTSTIAPSRITGYPSSTTVFLRGDGTWAAGNSGTVTSVSISGSTGLGVSGSPITTNGTIDLTLGSELQALSAFVQTGLIARTGSGTYAGRTITASTGISISNGDGILGNPVISISTIPISNLSGYPSNSSLFLRGDGAWAGIPTIDINNGTSGQLSIGRLSGYPANSSFVLLGNGSWGYPNYVPISSLAGYPGNSSLFLRGDGQWATAVTQFPVTVTTSNSSLEVISTYNYNSSAYGTGIGFYNQNSNGIIFGLNNSTSEGYVWSTNNISLKFGTNNILRMQIYNDGSIDCFSNNLNTTGSIAAGNFYSNNWSSYSLPYIYINSPVSNLTLYSDLKLNGNRITDSNGLHRMSFVGGTLEVSSSITTGRYYSYGWLNSSGGTGAASGTNYYSIVCQDRIAASEFNATSSKKIKKIIPNLNIENLKQKFLNLNFYQYNYIDNSDGQGDHYGVIAEDLSLIFPQFVDMEKERHIPNCIDEQGKMESIYFNGKEKDVYKFNHKLNLNNIDKNSKFVRLFINKIFYKASIINITPKKLYIYFENNDKITIDEYLKNNKVIYIYGTYEKCPTVEKNKLFEIGLILLQELLKKTN